MGRLREGRIPSNPELVAYMWLSGLGVILSLGGNLVPLVPSQDVLLLDHLGVFRGALGTCHGHYGDGRRLLQDRL